MWELIRDVATTVLLVFGAALSVAAGVGILRFPDALTRLHAATKPQILGLTCIMFAVVLQNLSWPIVSAVFVVLSIQYLTQPISAHLIGRSGYRSGVLDTSTLIVVELAAELAQIAASDGDGDGGDESAPEPEAQPKP